MSGGARSVGAPPEHALPPRLFHMPDGRASIHGTAVARDGRALLILGRAGAGKSGVAAQMIGLGARLVADDLVLLARRDDGVIASAPEAAASRIELRGIGPVAVDTAGPTPLAGVLSLGPSAARLPESEVLRLIERDVPLIRHPATADLAAKALLWLAAG